MIEEGRKHPSQEENDWAGKGSLPPSDEDHTESNSLERELQQLSEQINSQDQQSPPVPEFLLRNISVEALMQVLLEKRLVEFEELKQAELRLRTQARAEIAQQTSSDPEPTLFPEQKNRSAEGDYVYHKRRSHHSHSSSWLKRKMSKRRWTRRLGTLLFGWKWKRISKSTN